MTGDGRSENTVIETALIFYRQHLIKELQKCEISFSDNGSLPYSRADVERQDAFHHQLQSVTTIIESRRRDHTSEPSRSLMHQHSNRDGQGQHENNQGQQQTALPRSVLVRQNSVPPLPEVLSPSHEQSVSRGVDSRLPNYPVKEFTADETNQSQGVAPLINPTSNMPGKVAAFEPPMQSSNRGNDVTTQGMRDASWQPVTLSNTVSELERPTAQVNPLLNQNPGASSNLYPPVPVSKRSSPASSVTSHEARHMSTPSASTDEALDHTALREVTHPEPPLSPPPPPPAPPKSTIGDTPKVRLRAKPSFHVSALADFSNNNGNGAQPASSVHPAQQLRSATPNRSPNDLESPPPLPTLSKQRKPQNNTNGNTFMKPGESNAFPPLSSAKQNQERPSFPPARLSSDSESFSLPIFSNEAKTADEYSKNTAPTDRNRFEFGAVPYQHSSPGSFSSRAASDGQSLSQQPQSNSHSRSFSSQAPFASNKSSPMGSAFQSTSAFSKKPDSPKASSEELGKPNVPHQANTLSPNRLSAAGSVPPDSRRTQNSMTRKPAPEVPERLASRVPKNFNGISPNQLKPARLEMGQEIDRGQVPPESAPRIEFGAEPPSAQEAFITNKIGPNSLGGSTVASGKIHSMDSSDRAHTTASFFNSRPKIEEEQRLAQVVADLADQEEMAMLRKMQDDWNRDEDERAATQGSHTRNSYQDRIEDRGDFNPIQFAASPDIGTAPSNIVVRPIRSAPAQNKRTPAIAEPTESPSIASNPDRLPKPKDPECTVCGDTLSSPSERATLPCNHTYHPKCLASGFQHALAGGKLFICCKALPAPIDIISSHLSPQFVAKYKAKIIERSTPNPIYCAKPGCAAFIAPENITGPLAKCATCSFVTCKMCRNPEHKGVCPPDKDGGMLMQLAGSNKWCQCQRCKSMVERDEGCLHMTCTCGHEFCYNCGGVWDTCHGSCPRKS